MKASRPVPEAKFAPATYGVCAAVMRWGDNGGAGGGFENPSEIGSGCHGQIGMNDRPPHAQPRSVASSSGCRSIESTPEVGIFPKHPDVVCFCPRRNPLVRGDHNHFGSSRRGQAGGARCDRSAESRSLRLTEYGREASLGNAERLDGDGCKDHGIG